MKTIKSYEQFLNEAVVIPQGYKEFIDEIESSFRGDMYMSFAQLVEIAKKYDILICDYDEYYKSLPDIDKSTAPPKTYHIFGLMHPTLKKPMLVISDTAFSKQRIPELKHILKHELVHSGQQSKRTWLNTSLVNPMDRKAYFSNKDEVMAFSNSVVDMIMNRKPKNISDAIKILNSNGLYNDIKKSVDTKILNRYNKYIYQYLESEFR